MKKAIHLILFYICINCYAQDKSSVRTISPELLREKISKGQTENNLIYTYSDWCAPCIKEFPKVIDFCKANNVGLYIIVLSKSGNTDLNKLELKLENKYKLISPELFNFQYKEEYIEKKTKNNFKGYQAFMAELLAENYHADYIYGWDIIVLTDKQGKTKIVSAGGSFDDVLNRIKDNL